MTVEISDGESIKAKIQVSNESDGTTGKYQIQITVKDKNSKTKFLKKQIGTTLPIYAFASSSNSVYEYIKESMTVGTSYSFEYTAEVPDDFAEGDVEGKVEIYDETGATFIVGTEFGYAYTFKKKKLNLGSLSLNWEKV